PAAIVSSSALVGRLELECRARLACCDTDRRVFRAAQPLRHHGMPTAVEDDDHHVPVVLPGFRLGGGHYPFCHLKGDRRPIDQRCGGGGAGGGGRAGGGAGRRGGV